MSTTIQYKDLGSIEYKEAWEYQESLFNNILSNKINNGKQSEKTQIENDNILVFCEHPNVFTLGKSGMDNNLLINDEFLQKINASFFKTNRGGDITYHGPGQIVAYPIFDLEKFNLGVKEYIHKLEDVIINTLSEYNIQSERLNGATGVWLDTNIPGKARKICAIGVKASRYVTMHGFAFNINTDLSYFNHINPCGYTDKSVTSLSKELNKNIDIKEVKSKLLNHFANSFKVKVELL